jgi:hypothetical protein
MRATALAVFAGCSGVSQRGLTAPALQPLPPSPPFSWPVASVRLPSTPSRQSACCFVKARAASPLRGPWAGPVLPLCARLYCTTASLQPQASVRFSARLPYRFRRRRSGLVRRGGGGAAHDTIWIICCVPQTRRCRGTTHHRPPAAAASMHPCALPPCDLKPAAPRLRSTRGDAQHALGQPLRALPSLPSAPHAAPTHGSHPARALASPFGRCFTPVCRLWIFCSASFTPAAPMWHPASSPHISTTAAAAPIAPITHVRPPVHLPPPPRGSCRPASSASRRPCLNPSPAPRAELHL